jgi:hypothetical protein
LRCIILRNNRQASHISCKDKDKQQGAHELLISLSLIHSKGKGSTLNVTPI